MDRRGKLFGGATWRLRPGDGKTRCHSSRPARSISSQKKRRGSTTRPFNKVGLSCGLWPKSPQNCRSAHTATSETETPLLQSNAAKPRAVVKYNWAFVGLLLLHCLVETPMVDVGMPAACRVTTKSLLQRDIAMPLIESQRLPSSEVAKGAG